ncbi:hypothetical protein C8R44DRAFT_846099 [Mycena epipterygia]|nr:hypothetical protein C8R44DRAFT_846099 [Mycena epipterygia]
MHRALQIPELVEMICSQISPDELGESSDSGSNELAALARTSKIFQDDALNCLWRCQYTLAYILRCMPEDLWDGPVLAGHVDRLDITRPIAPTDWERPLFYLSRVKWLDLSRAEDLPSEALFETLSLCLPAEHLFPNLKTLSWTYVDAPLFPYIRIVLGPKITNIEINLTTTMSHLSLIPTLALRCPHLTDVQVSYEYTPIPFHDEIRTSVSLFVRGLKRLRSLRVNDLDRPALEHLATLPTLTLLTLENIQGSTRFFPKQLDPSRFSTLESLAIWLTTAEAAIFWIESVSHSALADLSITMSSPPTTQALSALYVAVAENIPCANLCRLQVDVPYPFAVAPFDESSDQSVVEKREGLTRLFRFHNLTNLGLESLRGFDLDDALVLEMAQAWPNLRTLQLLPNGPASPASRVTLAALRSFAHHCPKLVSLGIELDAGTVPVAHEGDKQDVQTKLNVLSVGFSPISNPSAVASFIFDIFPEVSDLYGNRGNGGINNLWAAVKVEIGQKRLWQSLSVSS